MYAQRHLATGRRTGAGEQRLAALPERLVGVHAGAVVAEERLGHERRGLAVLLGDVLDDVLVHMHLVGHLHQAVEAHVDLGLAGGGHFVVLSSTWMPTFSISMHHLGADVLLGVGGRHREVAFLVARLVAEVRLLVAAGVPVAFGASRCSSSRRAEFVIEADVVEDEELGLGAEVGRCRRCRST